MMFLPMVQRELRVMSRRRSTYRLRWMIGGVAFLAVSLMLLTTSSSGTLQQGGKILFYVSCFYSACICMLGGLFTTADIISEERREGTLGLLFLTDLNGYDVVLGKLSAVALNTFYWLMAILPVLSLPILFGGVTFGEFARVCLALVNLLFFTMCVGTWSSSRQLDSMQSVFLSVLILLLFCALLPLGYSFAAGLGVDDRFSVFTFSPTQPFSSGFAQTYSLRYLRFWLPLLSSHLLGWVCLLFASRTTTTIWRKVSLQKIRNLKERASNWQQQGFVRRQKFLDENPALWLMRPTHAMQVISWSVTAFGVVLGLITFFSFNGTFGVSSPFSGGALWMAVMPLKLLLVYQACSFVTLTRRSGAFELLLVTPLTINNYIAAHKRSINRTFGRQFLLLAIILLANDVKAICWYQTVGRSLNGSIIFFQCYQMAMLAIDYYLLTWLAFSSSLETQKVGWAFIRTVLLGMFIPSVFCWLDFFIKPIMLAAIAGGVEANFKKLVSKLHDPDVTVKTKPFIRDYSTVTLGGSE